METMVQSRATHNNSRHVDGQVELLLCQVTHRLEDLEKQHDMYMHQKYATSMNKSLNLKFKQRCSWT